MPSKLHNFIHLHEASVTEMVWLAEQVELN